MKMIDKLVEWWNKPSQSELDDKFIEKIIVDFKSFCKRGESFKYLGIEFLCTGIWWAGLSKYPKLGGEYVDNNGVIRERLFNYDELDLLKKENV